MLSVTPQTLLDHAAWEHAMWASCSPMTVRPCGGGVFRAGLDRWDIGDLGLRVFRAPRYVARQTPREIHRAQRRNLVLTLILDGRAQFSQFGRSLPLTPGEAGFHLTSRPMEYAQESEATVVLVHVPAARMALHAVSLEDVCAVPIPGDEPLLAGLLGALQVMPEIAGRASARVREAYAEGVTGMLGALCGQVSGRRGEAGSALKRQRLNAVKAFIDARLAEACLNPDRIAQANGISVRYLHHLFRADGTSVTNWICERRLERSCRVLESAELRALGVSEIGLRAGFASEAQFRRAFKARFGLAPREYRRARQAPGLPAVAERRG